MDIAVENGIAYLAAGDAGLIPMEKITYGTIALMGTFGSNTQASTKITTGSAIRHS